MANVFICLYKIKYLSVQDYLSQLKVNFNQKTDSMFFLKIKKE